MKPSYAAAVLAFGLLTTPSGADSSNKHDTYAQNLHQYSENNGWQITEPESCPVIPLPSSFRVSLRTCYDISKGEKVARIVLRTEDESGHTHLTNFCGQYYEETFRFTRQGDMEDPELERVFTSIDNCLKN